MNKVQSEFVEYVKAKCKLYNIKFELRKVTYLRISGNIHCAGYFDGDDKRLVVAWKHSNWLETLVHEYCHMNQWIEQCPSWVNMGDGPESIDRWLGGEDILDIDTHISAVRDMELDNEQRSTEVIRKWGLGIDIVGYIKKANAYVYFYNWIKETRRWSNPKNSPYGNQYIIEVMPTNFDNDYTIIPKNIKKVYKEQNI